MQDETMNWQIVKKVYRKLIAIHSQTDSISNKGNPQIVAYLISLSADWQRHTFNELVALIYIMQAVNICVCRRSSKMQCAILVTLLSFAIR